MNEARIIELEIKSAYQEELLETLNAIVAEQQQQISHLEQLYQRMNDQLQAIKQNVAGNGTDEYPQD